MINDRITIHLIIIALFHLICFVVSPKVFSHLNLKLNALKVLMKAEGLVELIEKKTTCYFRKRTFNLLSNCPQFFTFVFQSQVCLSISKASPDGHRKANNPCTEHRTTSRQSSSVVRRKYSDGGRPLHSSASFSFSI